jgi:iron complex outermembrane receptor protein
VVNTVSPQDVFRTAPFAGTFTGVTFDAGSANAQAGVGANVQHGRGPWLAYGSVTSRRTGDYDSPAGTVENSSTRLVTGEGGFNWSGPRAYFGAGGSIERNRYGIPYAGQFEGEPDAQIDIDVARQALRLDFGGRNLGGRFADAVRVTTSFLDYQHDEIESEDGTDTPGTRFSNRILTMRAEVEQKRNGRLAAA